MEFKSLYLPDMIMWEEESLTDTFGRLEITPLERGFGRTLGTALRRVMLSSLEGSAPVSLSIKGVEHEFSTIPGVLQDVPEIVLNIKSLIVRLSEDEPGILELKASKKGTYSGGDFKSDKHLTIINTDQEIAELDKTGKLDMKISIEKGKGFIPADEWILHGKEEGAGTILLDSWFCPIKKVNFEVSSARVGDRTDYDHLFMDVTTDGSMSPKDAVNTAVDILITHLQMIPAGLEPSGEVDILISDESQSEDILSSSLEDAGIPTRIANVLKTEGIETIGELLQRPQDEVLSIGGFGPSSLEKVNEVLKEKGLSTIS